MAAHNDKTTNSVSQGNTSAGGAQHAITTQEKQRLKSARKRISASCAEYNYFNPTHQPVNSPSQYAARFREGLINDKFLSPAPEIMKRDLQALFERVEALQRATAYLVYESVAVGVRNMANNEHSGFDWESFQEVVAKGVLILREQGFLVEVGDLTTLPVVAKRLEIDRQTEEATVE